MNRRCVGAALLAVGFGVLGCSESPPAPAEPTEPATTETSSVPIEPAPSIMPPAAPAGAQPRLAADPGQVADDLVADLQLLRDPSASDELRAAAARRQQAAYRAIGRHPEWDGTVRPRIPAPFLDAYDLNIDARRNLDALTERRDTVPPWRIQPPAPAEELLGYYHEAEAASGVGWNYLAAVNLVETRFGSIVGDSTAGAQGPMQFIPSTFAAYGEGDVRAPRDAIMAAGRYLAANGFAAEPDRAIFRYNNANEYVRAVSDYAAVLAADPAAYGDYYGWDVYYRTTAGDVLLPIGYAESAPIPAAEYLATHPQ